MFIDFSQALVDILTFKEFSSFQVLFCLAFCHQLMFTSLHGFTPILGPLRRLLVLSSVEYSLCNSFFLYGCVTCHLSLVDNVMFKDFSSFPSAVLFSFLSPVDV